jgi:hypothetical protein
MLVRPATQSKAPLPANDWSAASGKMMFDTRAVQCALTPFNSLVLQEEMSSDSAIMTFELRTRLRRFAQLVPLLPDCAPQTRPSADAA